MTKAMLNLIVSKHTINEAFYQLPSCFYVRKLDYEGSYCVPYTQSGTGEYTGKTAHNGATCMHCSHLLIEIMYTIRYPEYKEGEDGEEGEWVIRQSGIYQRLNTVTHQNLIILLSPNNKSVADTAIQDLLLKQGHGLRDQGPLWAHQMLLSSYLPAWRRYIAAQERELLPIVSSNKQGVILGRV